MKRLLGTYLPVSLLLVFVGMTLMACGGGGDGGSNPATLTGLSISGPSSMTENGTAAYTATASWSDSSTSPVAPAWSVNSQMASISSSGVLSCQGIVNGQTATITATYSSGGITKTATMDVTITSAPSIPFTQEELSGKVFFSKNFLYILHADNTLEIYADFGNLTGVPSYYVTGTWSNDDNGLHLNFRFIDYGPAIVQRITDSPTEMEVEYFDTAWGFNIPNQTWEKTVPVDPVKLPGTYTGSDGYTWVFNAGGTGSVSGFGGLTFTWSVDSAGVLRMPSNTGYTAVFYARATSQTTATSYTILKVGFTEHNTSTGNFYKYYGGMDLTSQ